VNKKIIVILAVTLMFAAVVPSLYAQDQLLNESFEVSVPPAGWTHNAYNYGATWYQGNAYSYMFISDGSWAAYCWWSWGYQDEWLITPEIDLTGYPDGSEILFGFSSGFYKEDGCDHTVNITTDGESWDEIIDLARDVPGSDWTYATDYPNPFEFDISEYYGETIQIGFNYWWMGEPGGRGVWSIDEVWVTGEGGSGPPPEGIDLEMKQVIRPNVVEEGGTPFTPACRIYNPVEEEEPTGYLATVDAEVRCRIKNLDNQQTVYEDVLHSYPLEYGYNEVSAFRAFTPEGNVQYEVLFVVTHPEDENEQNNDIFKRFSSQPGVDVTAIAVLEPSASQVNSFTPKATFEEHAGAETTDADLHCKIEDMTYSAVVYEETIAGETFAADESKDITFPEVTDLANGSYKISFWATSPLDGLMISDPILEFTFDYSGIAENPVVSTFDLKVLGNEVTYSLANGTDVSLRVYDVAGNMVSALASGSHEAGSHSVDIEGLGSGVYFVKLVTPMFTDVAKVTIVK